MPAGASVPGISAPDARRRCASRPGCRSLSRDSDVPLHERLPGEPGRGFARLPPPSAGDVFFDIEGDPYWGREGLEYLFGSLTEDGYQPLWAHDRAQERAAFERWVDWITARLERHPDLHVYHYNHYEPTALKALMVALRHARGRGRRAAAPQGLRRPLHVVRQALRIGTESYSLKAVEAMYPFERDAEVTEAGGSILAYQEYLGSRDARKLEAIADYNADDCRSTLGLRDWLLAERGAVGYLDAAPPAPPSAQQLARHAEVERLEAELLAGGEDPRQAAARRPAPVPPARGEARVVGVLRPARAHRRRSCATTTPRRSATSCPPTTCRSARSRSPTCTRCASRPSSTSSRPGSPSTR